MIIEGAKRKAFCSEKCLHSHLRVDSEHVICCICCQRMRFSDSIRRVCDSRYFCSLRCSIVAETGMDLLMRNDERCHLNNLSLKCATSNPELASYDTIERNCTKTLSNPYIISNVFFFFRLCLAWSIAGNRKRSGFGKKTPSHNARIVWQRYGDFEWVFRIDSMVGARKKSWLYFIRLLQINAKSMMIPKD